MVPISNIREGRRRDASSYSGSVCPHGAGLRGGLGYVLARRGRNGSLALGLCWGDGGRMKTGATRLPQILDS